ncbi:type IV secretion system protein [Bartonella sp. B1099]|uniref:type IV secretion system protein n=1 Tax=Bartonella sp. B1099 TaxID=2911422 RepID=UPI0020C453D3|nr:type IV secretion system protein [Bartonella sp. B1099]
MKRRFIITAMITLLEMLNLAPANADADIKQQDSIPQLQSQPPSKKNLEIIELLKKQIELSKKKSSETLKIHDSITGNGIKKALPNENQYFLNNLASIYPKVQNAYQTATFTINRHTLPSFYHYTVRAYDEEELRDIKPIDEMRTKINTRIRYKGVIARALSLQALQDVDKRFERIANLLDTTGKMQSLKEATKLQAELKYMLAMIQNESVKMQMIRNFFNNEENLIKMQKARIYLIASLRLWQMPTIKFP